MKKLTTAVLAAMIAVPTASVVPTAAANAGYYDSHHVYHGSNGRYRYRCRRSSGTTGTIAGAVGGGTLGTLAGAGGGALLGRHLDKRHDAAQNRRNGC